MDNDAAMAVLVAQRTAVNEVINRLARYVEENGNWLASVRTAQKAAIQQLAAAGGADLSTWT